MGAVAAPNAPDSTYKTPCIKLKVRVRNKLFRGHSFRPAKVIPVLSPCSFREN